MGLASIPLALHCGEHPSHLPCIVGSILGGMGSLCHEGGESKGIKDRYITRCFFFLFLLREKKNLLKQVPYGAYAFFFSEKDSRRILLKQ
jgi:hypothetical protein